MRQYRIAITIFLLLPSAVDAQSPGTVGDGPRTVTLQECLDLSSQNDPYLRNAELDVRAAQAQKEEAVWSYFPQVSVNALGFYALDPLLKITPKDILGNSDAANELNNYITDFAYQNGMKPYYSTLQQGWTASAMAIQPIFAGGRILNGNRLAAIGVDASRLQLSVKQRETRQSVEKKYWQVFALQEKLLTLADTEALLDTLERDASSGVAAGLVQRSDLMQVHLKQSEVASGKIQLRSGIKLAKMDLFNAIGLEYSYLGIDEISLADSVTDSLYSPDHYVVDEGEVPEFDESRLLGIRLEAARLQKRVADGELLPSVGVGISYGYSHIDGLSGNSFNGVGFATVKIPITDLGKLASRSRRYGYAVDKAANEKAYLDSQLLLQLRKLQLDMDTAWEQMSVASEAVDYADDAATKLKVRHDAGQVTMSELLQADLELRNARETYIDRRIDYRIAVNSYLCRINTKEN